MTVKKLFTLNRQLFDKETKQKIGNIESFHPTFDIEEIQAKISNIRHEHHKQKLYDVVNSRGKEAWSKDYIYSFTVYGKNRGAIYWIEYHELPFSSAVMHDNDLR